MTLHRCDYLVLSVSATKSSGAFSYLGVMIARSRTKITEYLKERMRAVDGPT